MWSLAKLSKFTKWHLFPFKTSSFFFANEYFNESFFLEKLDLNQLIRSDGRNFSILTTKFDLKTKSNTEVWYNLIWHQIQLGVVCCLLGKYIS